MSPRWRHVAVVGGLVALATLIIIIMAWLSVKDFDHGVVLTICIVGATLAGACFGGLAVQAEYRDREDRLCPRAGGG